jgi:hypothetical protein
MSPIPPMLWFMSANRHLGNAACRALPAKQRTICCCNHALDCDDGTGPHSRDSQLSTVATHCLRQYGLKTHLSRWVSIGIATRLVQVGASSGWHGWLPPPPRHPSCLGPSGPLPHTRLSLPRSQQSLSYPGTPCSATNGPYPSLDPSLPVPQRPYLPCDPLCPAPSSPPPWLHPLPCLHHLS